jgi:hydrogenase maturation protease
MIPGRTRIAAVHEDEDWLPDPWGRPSGVGRFEGANMKNSVDSDSGASTLVVGVGNLLMGDDGIGVRVAQALEGAELPPGVRAVDAGTGGVTLIGLLEEADQVILIDAADMGKPPGTCAVFSPEEVRSLKKDSRLSLHHADLLGLLDLMRTLSMRVPVVRVVGVQPESVEWRDRLSATLQNKLPEVMARVRAEVRRMAGKGGALCTK